MTVQEATSLIEPGVIQVFGNWADIGAGTGLFTKALMEMMKGGNWGNGGNRESRGSGGSGRSRIYAVDKSPHALWQLKSPEGIELHIVEADFNEPLDLPPLDGIVMANALHYATDSLLVLNNVVSCLRQGGVFVLVEYETETPIHPWVPNPVPYRMFASLCAQAGLTSPEKIGTLPSQYGYDHIYAASTRKRK